jgi:SAM-dependent methyltransferase
MTQQTPARFPGSPVPRDVLAKADSLFRSPEYQRHNWRRQEHLASLGLDLNDKSVLEVGAGVGDHTTFFLDRDCTVVSLEPRIENCMIFAATMQRLQSVGYSKASRSKLICADIESLDQKLTERFEIVYCYGLLYHLADPESALRSMAARCTDLLLLETCVSFGDRADINSVSEPQVDPTQSFRGVGCRPTRPWLFAKLKALFAHAYVPQTQPAHDEFPLDWTNRRPHQGLTRAIFVASRRPMINARLLDHLPDRQTRC